MKPLKIAYVDLASDMGGAEYVLASLLESLPRDVVSPLLVLGPDGNSARYFQTKHIRTIFVSIPPLLSTSFVYGRHKFVNPVAVVYDCLVICLAGIRMADCLRAEQVDIVQTNTLFAHFYGGIAARILRVPCIWHVHDLLEGQRFWGLAGIVWKQLAHLFATVVVGASNSALLALGPSPQSMTIYAGINPNRSTEEDWRGWRKVLGLGEDTILVGYLGRVGWVKGLEILVDAAKLLVKSDSRIHFVIMGDSLFGEQAYQKRILEKVKGNGLEANWHSVGHVSNSAQKLDELVCLVLPSFKECFPRVLLEAGLAGKPVVATRVGGVPEIVVEGETGLLVRPHDAVAMANSIQELIANPTLAADLGQKAKSHITKNFNFEKTIRDFVGVYAKIERMNSSNNV